MKDKKWRKVLYEDQGYPDNYYETSEFLIGLKTNVNVVHYTLLQAISGSSYLISQINVVTLFLILFELVQMEIVEFKLLFSITISAAFFCFLCYLRSNFNNLLSKDTIIDDLQSLVTMICLGYGFTPIIRTLTTTISTDTIYTMTFCLFLFSLVFHDYGMDAPIVSRAYSLNLSLAASICLISRLKDNPTAFCFLSLALCCFGFWPNFRNQIASDFPKLTPLFQSVFLIPASIFCTTFISIPLTILNGLIQFFILFVCPFILVKMQHLKSTIHGPWDEAIIYDLQKDD
uniref:Phosphatidylinositol N-acetylglucosaminyltransferase subunit C n=1 Tax=Panagrolaimus sp. PS1159 TaxID=55785 RepID=A0AC35G101_9BILA